MYSKLDSKFLLNCSFGIEKIRAAALTRRDVEMDVQLCLLSFYSFEIGGVHCRATRKGFDKMQCFLFQIL